MRKLLFILLAFALVLPAAVRIPGPGGAGAAPSVPVLIDHTCSLLGINGSATTPLSTINTVTANWFAVTLSDYSVGGMVTVTEDQGNGAPTATLSYRAVTANGETTVAYWESPAHTSATHQFTITGSSSYSSACVYAYKNMAASSTLDTESSGLSDNTGNTCPAGAVSTGTGSRVILSTFVGPAPLASGTLVVGSGLTTDIGSLGSGTAWAFGSGSLIQSGVASINPTWTFTSGGSSSACLNVAFKGQ